MSELTPHSFRLLLNDGRVLDDLSLADRLHEAGFGDLTFGVRAGLAYADVEREGDDLEQVVLDTLVGLEAAIEGLRVVRVEPDEFVSASRIAERTGRTRQSINQLVSGTRGPGDFPVPVTFIDAQTRVWRWSSVCEWFSNALGEPWEGGFASAQAEFLAALNGALAAREHLRRYEEGGGSHRHASRVKLIATSAPHVSLLSGGSPTVAILRACVSGSETIGSRPAEADALLHLGCRIGERTFGKPQLGKNLSSMLSRALCAYDTSVVLHSHGRPQSAQPFDFVVIDAATRMGEPRGDDELSAPIAMQPLRKRQGGRVPLKPKQAVHADPWNAVLAFSRADQVQVVERWITEHSLRPQLLTHWREAIEPLEDESDKLFWVTYLSGSSTSAVLRARYECDDQYCYQPTTSARALVTSLALTQVLAYAGRGILHADERHLLTELSEHVRNELERA